MKKLFPTKCDIDPMLKSISNLKEQQKQAEQDNDPIEFARLSIKIIELQKRMESNV